MDLFWEKRLREQRQVVLRDMAKLSEAKHAERREYTPDEVERVHSLNAEHDRLTAEIPIAARYVRGELGE